MSAPFFKYGMFGDEVSLIVAFLIGIAFGVCLERAGFGNARLLAAQFYFRDLRVLKVMFTAIVTAMVGVYLLARVGVLDLSLVYLTPTLILPQIVGGLLLGAGFIVGGYCPGTSCVSAATGRIDGMAFLVGMIGGLVGFGEVYPAIERFAHSTPLGQVTLPQFLKIPHGVVVLLVVLMALAAFVAAEWAERKFGNKVPDAGALTAPTRKLTPVRRLAVAFIIGGVVAAIGGNPYRGPFAKVDARQLAEQAARGANRVQPRDLADWLIAGRSDFLLVDLRTEAQFTAYHIPGAVNIRLAGLSRDVAPRNQTIICYGEDETTAAEASLVLRAGGFPTAYALAGGLKAWETSVLFPAAPAHNASSADQQAFARRLAIARHFGGAPRDAAAEAAPAAVDLPKVLPPAPVAPTQAAPAVRKKKEGC